MKALLKKAWSKFLTAFGNVKVFSWPMFVVYDPCYFKMTGDKILDVVSLLRPGDVLIRGYDGYLDGAFIKSKRAYSHAGVYIGKNEIVHAVAPKVEKTWVVDFCECDRVAVLRPRRGTRKAVAAAKKFLKDGVPYDFFFGRGTSALYCFELARECYPGLAVGTTRVSGPFGIFGKDVVLSDDLFGSKDFRLVFEYNPKYGIDFRTPAEA